MEKRPYSGPTHPAGGTAPELVQAIEQAALATEAEGWHDTARVLRGWAEQLETQSLTEGSRRSELWLG